MNHFEFELRRLRRMHGDLDVELRRLERDHGLEGNRAHNGRRGNGRVNGGRVNDRRGPNALINELRGLNLDEQAENQIRAAVHENDAREAERGIAAIQLERRRQRARSLQQEQRLQQVNLEKEAVENERRDIEIFNAERELETARLQLQAERDMRRH